MSEYKQEQFNAELSRQGTSPVYIQKGKGQVITTIVLETYLKEQLDIAFDLLENHHVNCEWSFEPDLNADDVESCEEFGEMFGKNWNRLTCFEHDKLREWQIRIQAGWTHRKNQGN